MSAVTNTLAPADVQIVFKMVPGLQVLPLDSCASSPQYVAKTEQGRSLMLSERLRDILLMLDGARDLEQIALEVSRLENALVTPEKIRNVIDTYLLPYGLVETVQQAASCESVKPRVADAKSVVIKPLDFIFKIVLIKPQLAMRMADRFTWLYKPGICAIAIVGFILAHFAFYGGWLRPRQTTNLSAWQYLFCYGLVLLTALFHEIGHAAACRNYKCTTGGIGLLLYIIFPAFYVNLSDAWRLSGRQRAVIDIGGIYFQLITVIPLFLVFAITGSNYCAAAIYSVDALALLSLNPLLKFDGYWLLVDLTGLINLKKRSWKVVKEMVLWSLGFAEDMPTFKEVKGQGRKFVLATYSFLSIAFFSTFIVLLLIFTPDKVFATVASARDLVGNRGTAPFLISVLKLFMNLFFLLFVFAILKNTLFKLLKKTFQRRAI
ncbi:MAG: hypothetical protein WBV94_24185 [Blastocatellia bacterium]